MKTKKLLALLLAVVMVAAVFAGCKGTTTNPETSDPGTSDPGTVPEGAVRADDRSYLEYEVIIPADGIGDHPAYAILTSAKEAFASIGITLEINDPADSNVLWDALDAGTQDMWTAAWGSTIDPDMYQVYYSGNIVGLGGSDSNHYHIASELLDQLILDARASDDQAYRKSVYKEALDEIMDWAVELPTYQRKNIIIFSTERVNLDTLTPDITTFWGWMSEIEKLQMTDAAAPLVVAYSPFSQKFSPFYADTAYDQDVVAMTQLSLLTTDRMGGIIYNAIDGETVSYNGTDYLYTGPADVSVEYDEATDTTTYTAKIRQDLMFSDGTPVTADDIIFTYYVYLDPAYVGSTTLNSYGIVGLDEYQQQAEDVYAKYQAIADAVYAAGEGYTATDADTFTQAEYDAVWAAIKAEWIADVQAIVDYCVNTYASAYAESYIGKTEAEVMASTGLQVALGMALWGFGEVDDAGILTASATGTTWDLNSDALPTVEDYYAEAYAGYGGDVQAYDAVEPADGTGVWAVVCNDFIQERALADAELGEGTVANISGITKIDDYTVQVVTNGYEAPAVYSILGIQITPLHYYGDAAQYDYANNMFGHPYGDLSLVESKTTAPMGAGAYIYQKFENRIVYYAPNPYYYKGAPIIQSIQFKETNSNEVEPGVVAGTVDAGELNGSQTVFAQVRKDNSNGELVGDILTLSLVDNLGYGYLGVNADTVNVAGEPGSEASRNLRKALLTILAVYRDVAIDSYYGDMAAVINYPISNTSWAAPQATDSDYELAFSVDVDGNPIYTADMTQEEMYAAAITAALGFFEAAGFTVTDGVVVAGPAA